MGWDQISRAAWVRNSGLEGARAAVWRSIIRSAVRVGAEASPSPSNCALVDRAARSSCFLLMATGPNAGTSAWGIRSARQQSAAINPVPHGEVGLQQLGVSECPAVARVEIPGVIARIATMVSTIEMERNIDMNSIYRRS